MLVERYPGEGQEYEDPREAVNNAIDIAKAWRKDVNAGPRKDRQPVTIAHGATGGMTMPFEGERLTAAVFKELREWADKEWEKLDKCCQCGAVIRDRDYVYLYDDEDFKFCDSSCAENYEIASAEELEDEEEEDEEDEEELIEA